MVGSAARHGLDPPEPGDPEVVLRVERVVRRFGGVAAVDGVSFDVRAGERLAIIGPNGAGKTTLFRVVAGELPVTSGRIHLFGRDVTAMPAHMRARMGLARTFQVSNLFGSLSVEDNVRLAAQAASSSRWRFWAPIRPDDEVGDRARGSLERVGLLGRASARVAALSHGEQRQLEIAMALAGRPRLLLLDEPAAGLAAAERARLRELLAGLPASLPVVLIEHDMSLALGIADTVLCLHNGRPIAYGRPGEVRANADVQAVYLGRERPLGEAAAGA
ncbi:MAG TPA: ABC transporter ATP-binding protein [Candidatus Limnocylindrales bacterium]|nr:ABC transporter ATP-binding protein [Candidatus Limnocylindrales bacterium]